MCPWQLGMSAEVSTNFTGGNQCSTQAAVGVHQDTTGKDHVCSCKLRFSRCRNRMGLGVLCECSRTTWRAVLSQGANPAFLQTYLFCFLEVWEHVSCEPNSFCSWDVAQGCCDRLCGVCKGVRSGSSHFQGLCQITYCNES